MQVFLECGAGKMSETYQNALQCSKGCGTDSQHCYYCKDLPPPFLTMVIYEKRKEILYFLCNSIRALGAETRATLLK